MTKKTLEKQIEELTAIANKIAAIAPAVTLPTVSTPSVSTPSVSPVMFSNTADHDLLQRVDTKVDNLALDIKEIKDGTSKQINDHEIRIKYLETMVTRLIAYGTSLIFVVGLAEFLLSKFLK